MKRPIKIMILELEESDYSEQVVQAIKRLEPAYEDRSVSMAEHLYRVDDIDAQIQDSLESEIVVAGVAEVAEVCNHAYYHSCDYIRFVVN